MRKLEGCDDRALLLEDTHLSALRWGSEQARVRVDFDRLALSVWVPLARQDEAERFVGEVNSAVANTSA